MTVPIETVRAASLDDSYIEFVKVVDDSDDFLRQCVNNGIPIRMSVAIDESVYALLSAAGIEYDVHDANSYGFEACSAEEKHEASRGLVDKISSIVVRHIFVDTMANATFLKPYMKQYMHDIKGCNAKIQVANAQIMKASVEGELGMHVLNIEGYEGIPLVQSFDIHGIITPSLNRELLSIDALYRSGFSALFKNPNYSDGIPELYRPSMDGDPEVRIPMTYDWWGPGGFRVYYVPRKGVSEDYAELLRRYVGDDMLFRSESSLKASEAYVLHAHNVDMISKNIADHPLVEEVINSHESPPPCVNMVHHPKVNKRQKEHVVVSKHVEDRQVKGVQVGLKRGRAKLNSEDMHKLYGHMGYCKGCKICQEIWGVMRAIKTKVNPHRELRSGYIFSMDMITWSHRSEEGNKYSIVLRDNATHAFEILNLYLKSDATSSIEEWVTDLRSNPIFDAMSYPICMFLKTDNDGAWGETNVEFQDMIKRVGINMYYVAPDRHAEANGCAEKACGIVEVVVKSLLAQRALPPSWWQRCSNAAKFLLNRFPVTSSDVATWFDR